MRGLARAEPDRAPHSSGWGWGSGSFTGQRLTSSALLARQDADLAVLGRDADVVRAVARAAADMLRQPVRSGDRDGGGEADLDLRILALPVRGLELERTVEVLR